MILHEVDHAEWAAATQFLHQFLAYQRLVQAYQQLIQHRCARHGLQDRQRWEFFAFVYTHPCLYLNLSFFGCKEKTGQPLWLPRLEGVKK